ncbi:MAG TPA: hypothetical protein VD993_11535 [Chitinophagaceae bacterium]|nr:hypothetical protein [Chitinophagaceae bacterium]
MNSKKWTTAAIIISFAMVSFSGRKHPGANASPRSIWSADWSADGKYIAIGGDDSTIWLFKAGDYSLYKTYKANSMVKGLHWHPKENLLAIANMTGIQLLDVQKGTLTTVPGLTTGGRGISWKPSGDMLALADGRGVVQLLDKQGNIIRSIKKHNARTYMTIDWHPTKDIFVTGSDEIIVFDTSGRQLSMFRHRKENTGVLSVKWHPSGKFFASGDYGHENEGMPTLLQFWKEDGTLLKTMHGHHEEIRNLRWSRDGNLLATGSDALRIWQKDGKLLHTGTCGEVLWGVAWSQDGKSIITGSYADGMVKLWDNKAKLVKQIKP